MEVEVKDVPSVHIRANSYWRSLLSLYMRCNEKEDYEMNKRTFPLCYVKFYQVQSQINGEKIAPCMNEDLV